MIDLKKVFYVFTTTFVGTALSLLIIILINGTVPVSETQIMDDNNSTWFKLEAGGEMAEVVPVKNVVIL